MKAKLCSPRCHAPFLLGQLCNPTKWHCWSEPRFPSWCESWSGQLCTRRMVLPRRPSSLCCLWAHLAFPATVLALEPFEPAGPMWVPADLFALLFWTTSFQGWDPCNQTWGIPLLLKTQAGAAGLRVKIAWFKFMRPHSPQENHQHASFGENSPNPALLH